MYILTLDGLPLHHYGQGVYGWGPISSTTGEPGRLVEWALRGEVDAWAAARPVFCAGAVIEGRPCAEARGRDRDALLDAMDDLNVSHMSDDQLARLAQIVDALTVEIEQEYMDRDDPADE